MIRNESGPFLNNPVIASIPQRFAECVRSQEQIDDTGREITLDDWDHSYRSFQINLAITPRSLPATPAAAGQRSGLPSSFRSFTKRQRANYQAQQSQNVLSPELDLLTDVNRYTEYINDGARFVEGWSLRFTALHADIRYDDIQRFDFVPGGRITYRVSENGLMDSQNVLPSLIQRVQNPQFPLVLTLVLVTQRIFLNKKMQHRISSGLLLPVAEYSLLLTANV